MIKINTSGDYVQLIYVDTVGESVQQELKSDTDAFECSYDSDGKLFLQFGAMRFENPEPTDFSINGVAVTSAADFISKLNALFTGGGGGATIYTGDGSLTGDRTVDLNEHFLKIQYDTNDWLKLNPTDWTAQLYSWNSEGATVQAGGMDSSTDETHAEANFIVYWDVADTQKSAGIGINVSETSSQVIHTADTHTFNGAVLMPSVIPLDFSDDAAAAIGGVAVGQLYHNAGAIRIRRS